MTSVAVVYHSQTGRTKALAEAAARGASSVDDVVAHVISAEDAARSQDVLAAADAIVFGCPTYMGSASAQFKAFMDGTAPIWALQGWRDKLAAGFTHSAAPSGDKLGTLTQLAIFAAQHGMIWVGLGLPPSYVAADISPDDLNRLGSHLGAMAQSRAGGGALPPSDARTCEHLGRRVAEVAKRWRVGAMRARMPSMSAGPLRHPTARSWALPPPERMPPQDGVERINLREVAARDGRFEHHQLVCATIGGAELQISTSSEPLAFAHINLSDEYAIALPSGDELVDRFPQRTFLSDPSTGRDVGRYNHRIGDLVLHPDGLLHWPGRLRPPYEPFEFPPGMRRGGLSLSYCASTPTPQTWCPLPPSPAREADAKAYVEPRPVMALSSLRGPAGVLAKIGRTTLSLVEAPRAIEPARGGWVVVLEADGTGPFFACDLLRVPAGTTLDARGIARAMVLEADDASPDPPPPLWRELPTAPLSPYEDGASGELPIERRGIRVMESSDTFATVTVEDAHAEVPRYWLARTLFRIALHGLRLGYVETYGGFFVDDRGGGDVRFGLRSPAIDAGAAADDDEQDEGRESFVTVPRGEALALIDELYRAVAPAGYRERAT